MVIFQTNFDDDFMCKCYSAFFQPVIESSHSHDQLYFTFSYQVTIHAFGEQDNNQFRLLSARPLSVPIMIGNNLDCTNALCMYTVGSNRKVIWGEDK